MLTGTETRPKEMVAVAIERAGIGRREREKSGLDCSSYVIVWCITKIANVGNFSLSNFYAGHPWPQVVIRATKQRRLLQTLQVPIGQSDRRIVHLSRSARSRAPREIFASSTSTLPA